MFNIPTRISRHGISYNYNSAGIILQLQLDVGEYTFTVKVSVDEKKASSMGKYPEKTLPKSGTATQIINVVQEIVTQLSIL